MGSSRTWESLAQELTTSHRAVLKWAFKRVPTGLAIGAAELAGLLHAPEDELWLSIRELQAAGLLQTDRQGSVVGALGLSLVPTQHQLTVSGRTLYGWCAEDVVGIPAALGWNAKVSSVCGQCGSPITVYLQAGEIVEPCWLASVRLWLNDFIEGAPVSSCTCPLVNFFCGSKHAEKWRLKHPEASGRLIDLEEAAEMGREIWGWLASGVVGKE